MASIFCNNESKHLNLTITPILNDDEHNTQPPTPNYYKQPDLTFHCISPSCEASFVNPFQLFHHMNTVHPVFEEETERTEKTAVDEIGTIEDEFDYSCVLEPVCEIVALAEKKKSLVVTASEAALKHESDSEDTDTDDDDSTTSSSSSNSSSSSDSVNSNNKSQNASKMKESNVGHDFFKESTGSLGNEIISSELRLFPDNSVNSKVPETTITPIRRRRGRRSNAQYMPVLSKQQKCFQCVHCEASFQNAGDLSKHVRSHITNKPFQCSICEKTFTHIGSLNTHLRIHSGDKPYKCELCPKAFTQSSSLMVHLRSHSIRKPHQCHLCDKGFVNSSSLVLHLKTHNETESFVCPECDKVFKQEDQLDEHMRMHTEELVYQCSICRTAFRTSSELVQHMKIHMGEKPFSCSICDARFTQSGSLNIHMRIHTGEKPFHCRICDKSFTQASSLSVHMKIHYPGEKPFPCHICGKAYSQQAYLNKHIQSHGNSQDKVAPESLMCIVCGSIHQNVKSLSRHVTEKHAALLTDFKDARNQIPQNFLSETASIEQLNLLLQNQSGADLVANSCMEAKLKIDHSMSGIDDEQCSAVDENVQYDFDYAAEEEVETAELNE